MQAGYGCFLQTYIVGIFKSADIKNWWHKKTALQDLFRPFFRIGLAFLGEKLCRFLIGQKKAYTLYKPWGPNSSLEAQISTLRPKYVQEVHSNFRYAGCSLSFDRLRIDIAFLLEKLIQFWKKVWKDLEVQFFYSSTCDLTSSELHFSMF